MTQAISVLTQIFHTSNHNAPHAWKERTGLEEKQFTNCLLANCFECHQLKPSCIKLSQHGKYKANTLILLQLYKAVIDPGFN